MMGMDKKEENYKKEGMQHISAIMANREEGAAAPVEDKDRNNLNPKIQLDKDTYISTGQILSQNFQESQKKMQKHIYYIQMIGWMPTASMKI